jgi:aspartate-semialdehyde dehydrogenase
VAFDVIPGGGIDCERVQRECKRLFGENLRLGVVSVQVPTFVGEGASLALELTGPMDVDAVRAGLNAMDGVLVARDGFGSRGLAGIEEDSTGPVGPTMRDAIGSDEILVGRIEADGSLPAGEGWRLWIAFEPLRLVADQALRLAGRRLGLK